MLYLSSSSSNSETGSDETDWGPVSIPEPRTVAKWMEFPGWPASRHTSESGLGQDFSKLLTLKSEGEALLPDVEVHLASA